MSHRILRRWVLSAVTGLAVGVGGSAHAQSVQPIVTKNASLRLPISLDDRTRAEVTEVKLYVRGPAGRWVMAQAAPATQSTFDFKAPGDGEYWFTFVTVDRRGRTSPANVETAPPHRIVVIDTKSVQAIPERPGSLPPRDFNPVEPPVRPGLEKGKPDPAKFPSVEPDRGVASPGGYNAGKPPVPPKLPRLPEPGIPDLKLPDVSVPDVAPLRPVGGVPAPAGVPDLKIPDVGVPPAAPKPEDTKLPDLPPVPTADVKIPDPPTKPAGPVGLPDLPSALPDIPADKTPAPVPPTPPTLPRESTSLKPAEAAAKPPTGSHPILNTRTCVINYESEGTVRVAARIDFWATKDGGRTWEPLRDEAGGIAPARLTLPGEGVYGIRIRPGSGSRPPEPGEEPDCVVEVDTTKPAVNLLQPTIGSGADEGSMLITWTAADKNLLSNSVSLFYATQSEGPWTEIARGYKNEGVYRWAMPTGLTGDIFVRLEASDRAGNVGRHDLNTPVSLDTGKGRVKVIGVGPGK